MKLRKAGGTRYWLNNEDQSVRVGDEVIVVRDEDGLEVITIVDTIKPITATIKGFLENKVHPIDFPNDLLDTQLEIAEDEVIQCGRPILAP